MRERQRVTEQALQLSIGTAVFFNQPAILTAAGRRSQSARKQERSRNKREGSSVPERNDVHLLSLPYLKQETMSLLSLAFWF